MSVTNQFYFNDNFKITNMKRERRERSVVRNETFTLTMSICQQVEELFVKKMSVV
jgi:hypothetical protein